MHFRKPSNVFSPLAARMAARSRAGQAIVAAQLSACVLHCGPHFHPKTTSQANSRTTRERCEQLLFARSVRSQINDATWESGRPFLKPLPISGDSRSGSRSSSRFSSSVSPLLSASSFTSITILADRCLAREKREKHVRFPVAIPLLRQNDLGFRNAFDVQPCRSPRGNPSVWSNCA